MYNDAVDGLEKHLVHLGPSDGLTYLSNVNLSPGGRVSQDHSMEHLACFVPGWLALGSTHLGGDPERQRRHLELAKKLAYTCWQMYEQQPVGIAPERVSNMKMDLSSTNTREYILRPEAAEALWVLHSVTGDPQYREWGWRMFAAMDKNLRVAHGYASMKYVRNPGRGLEDKMESFWVAETLKYLYMLQETGAPSIALDEWVLNTEAHPLPVLL